MVERPALVRTDDGPLAALRVLRDPGSKHWWIGVVEADDPAGLADAEAAHRLPRRRPPGVKDPVIRRAAAAGTPGSAATRWTCPARRTA